MEHATLAEARFNSVGQLSHGDDRALLARFYLKAVRQGFQSEKEGREIFADQEFIEILIAGDNTRRIDREVKEEDKTRFSAQYQAFKNQQAVVHEGTPLESWAAVSAATVLNLKAMNVHTVEQLSAVSDGLLTRLGTGAQTLRDKAKTFLKTAEDNKHSMFLQSELEKRDAQIADLQRQIKEIAESKGRKAA